MTRIAPLLVVACAARLAAASPATRCDQLDAKPARALAPKVRDKIYLGNWETAKHWCE